MEDVIHINLSGPGNLVGMYSATRIIDRVELYLCEGCEEHFPLEEFTKETGMEYCPTCTEYCLNE
jgi:hypothetical protein